MLQKFFLGLKGMGKKFNIFNQVGPLPFTVDGTAVGVVTVSSVVGFYLSQLVIVESSTEPAKNLQVKAIISHTQIQVGPRDNTNRYSSIDLYLVADGATIFAPEQQKQLDNENPEIGTAVYEPHPIAAIRTLGVDTFGDPWSINNPMPVLFGGSIAISDVRITEYDNDPVPGRIHSSVRVGDGVEDLEINPDGSINVVITPGAGITPKSFYSEVTSVANSILTTILTYTVPIATTATIGTVDVSGTNIAEYTVEVNATAVDKKRTYFSGPLNEIFNFNNSIPLLSGDVVTVRVIHNRPNVGDFNARLSVTEET